MLYVGSAGAVAGRRHTARVQTAVTQDSQMDDTALQPVQGGLGLDHPAFGHLHGHIYTVFRRVPFERTALQGPAAAPVQFRRPVGGGRFFR